MLDFASATFVGAHIIGVILESAQTASFSALGVLRSVVILVVLG